MQSDPGIVALSEELAQAIELTMNESTSQKARTEAYAACERFKETSPLSARIGFFIASGNYSNSVKHFGLHLMEHAVKFKWNDFTQEEKINIKENTMSLLFVGMGPAEDKSLLHLKDALSRVVVEMIKREWPQQWTSLLTELSSVCSRGVDQTEIVILVFLRLIEDVALLQTIESNQRRKDIYQALTMQMTEIFDFFLELIKLHLQSFRNAITIGETRQSNAHSRVVEVVLLTLTGLVEWVSVNHILCENGKLLQILCILLSDLPFQINAADCLSQIVNRKGQLKERRSLCVLFSVDTINLLFQAIKSTQSVATIEHNHMFLKKLSQILHGLAQILTVLYGKENGLHQCPESFPNFLQCIFSLIEHPSLVISHNGALIWNIILKHEHISKHHDVLEYIPRVIKVLGPKIIKVPFPNAAEIPKNISNVQSYIYLDYDCETEHNSFFHRCRTSYLETFRQSTLLAPLITFGFCEHWLNIKVSQASNEKNLANCALNDPIYLEWEALATILDNVMSRILFVNDRPPMQSGLTLLEKCLKVETNNPHIFSELLSCVSALFVFLSMSGIGAATRCDNLLLRVLDKIFEGLTFEGEDNSSCSSANNSSASKKLRRHAASLMVKLGHKYPLLLLPVFDELNLQLKNLVNNSRKISKFEEITMQEAFLLISNHFCDYERQTNYVGEILKSVKEDWIVLSSVLKSPMTFMFFAGLSPSSSQNAEIETYKLNRSQMIHVLYIVLGVIKRCSYPDDPDKAMRGGFVVGFTESGNPICRNPAAQHILPILPHILSLVKTLNDLYTTEAISHLSPEFKLIHEMSESEKKTLMNTSSNASNETDVNKSSLFDKVQRFLILIYEGCFHTIGSMGPSLGRDLYQMPGLSHALINSVFANLEKVPDHRLRPIIRVFLKPFIHCCPPVFHNQVLIPIFSCFAPYMFCRLKTRWQYITGLYEEGQLNEEINDSQEVLDDILNRTITREYLDVLKIALLGGHVSNDSTDIAMEQDEVSNDEISHSGKMSFSSSPAEVLSDLGVKLIQHSFISSQIFLTILSSLSWNDGTCNLKAINLFLPVVRFMAAENTVDENLAKNAVIAVLQGLQIHGQHEINQANLISLGVQIFEVLRFKFPCILEVMHQIPCVNLVDLQRFDEKIVSLPTKGNKVDRTRKELFKKITSGLINQSSNQLFKKEVKIANLPTIHYPPRNAQAIDILDNQELQDANIAKLFQ